MSVANCRAQAPLPLSPSPAAAMAAEKYLQSLFTYLHGQKLATGGGGQWSNLQANRVASACANLRCMANITVDQAASMISMLESSPLDDDQRALLSETIDKKIDMTAPRSRKAARATGPAASAAPADSGITGPAALGIVAPRYSRNVPAAQTGPSSSSGAMGPSSSSGDAAALSGPASEGDTMDQLHDFFQFYLTDEDWKVVGNANSPVEERLEKLADRSVGIGLLHPRETTAGKIASLGLLD